MSFLDAYEITSLRQELSLGRYSLFTLRITSLDHVSGGPSSPRHPLPIQQTTPKK